jgi:SRSO17 transposase
MVPLPPQPKGKMGRPPRLLRRDEKHQPLTAKELALCLSAADLRKVSWREGTRGMMRSRFAAVRVRVAHRDYRRNEPHPEQWLLIEWPATEKEPTKYWLSNLPAAIALRKLVALAKLRWRIERDYEELKQELGLGHFEGRNWRGFHHHATLSIAAYGFLVLERCLFPPSGNSRPLQAPNIKIHIPRVQSDYTPRGAARTNRTA